MADTVGLQGDVKHLKVPIPLQTLHINLAKSPTQQAMFYQCINSLLLDFMGAEQITVNFTVSGATTFDYEFVVKREGEGRIYPKVVHKQSDATSPVELKAPATMDEPVWLVITADKTGDGPTPDDLVGGTTSAIR